MENSNVIRALLCEKAELLRKSVRPSSQREKESLDFRMAMIDHEVDKLREAVRRRSMVVVREIRSVG